MTSTETDVSSMVPQSSESTIPTTPLETITTTTTTPTSTTTPNSSTQAEASSTKAQQMGTGPMAGIIVASVVGFVILVVIVLLLIIRRYRSKRSKKPPPMMPNPYPEELVAPVHSTSTVDLVRNESVEPTSADGLPFAPPIPLHYADPQEEVYVNETQEETYEPQDNYLQPSEWGDDVYIPMGGTTPMPRNSDVPVPVSAIVAELEDSKPPPPICVGPPGYVNVPNSGVSEPSSKQGHIETSEDELEDYENLPTAHSFTGKESTPKPQPEQLNVSKSVPNKRSPKGNHKHSPKPCKAKPVGSGESLPDYVNVNKYSKKPKK